MTALPTDNELATILRELRQIGALGDLATATEISERTLYRHTKTENRPEMGASTRRALFSLFSEVGLLGGYDADDLSEAVAAIQKRAATERPSGQGETRGPTIQEIDDATAAGAEPDPETVDDEDEDETGTG